MLVSAPFTQSYPLTPQVAVQGCSHGSLAAIYDSIARYTSIHGRTVDLLLLCGDFQALRSVHDFPSLAVPPKYHTLGTFHQYYSGEKVAPVLTIVIGGNHEASNYMWELYHGGWLAPRIYYLGAAGSVYVDGLRIVGASGIYKDHDYGKGGLRLAAQWLAHILIVQATSKRYHTTARHYAVSITSAHTTSPSLCR
jgi:lariat debranching enzyme